MHLIGGSYFIWDNLNLNVLSNIYSFIEWNLEMNYYFYHFTGFKNFYFQLVKIWKLKYLEYENWYDNISTPTHSTDTDICILYRIWLLNAEKKLFAIKFCHIFHFSKFSQKLWVVREEKKILCLYILIKKFICLKS